MGRKVLIVCGQEIIYENNDGGKKCSLRNYELFKEVFGEKNVFLCMVTNKYKNSEEQIIRFPSHSSVFWKIGNVLKGNCFTSQGVENNIIDFINNHDINIVLFERSMYGKMIKRIKQRKIRSQIWIFVHNIEKNYFWNKMIHQSFLFILPYYVIKHSEKMTFQYADYILTLTERDSRIIFDCYGKRSDIILPMSFRDNYQKEKKLKVQNAKRLLFIGSMFPPNYEGIKWFVENVMSEIEDYSLQIVGKNFEKRREELERSNVEVIGTVDDLEQFYYSDNIMIMPVFYGDGIKIKTAEAMMYGKIILATNEALEGYDVDQTRGIFRCNTKKEFIECIYKIQNDMDKNEMELSTRKLFLEKYCLNEQIEKCRVEWTGGE